MLAYNYILWTGLLIPAQQKNGKSLASLTLNDLLGVVKFPNLDSLSSYSSVLTTVQYDGTSICDIAEGLLRLGTDCMLH